MLVRLKRLRHSNECAVNERDTVRLNVFRFEHFEKLIEKGFIEVSVLHLFGKEPNGLCIGNGVIDRDAEKILKGFAVADTVFFASSGLNVACLLGQDCTDSILFADQDILNCIFEGNVVYVPLKWNCVQHHRITFFPWVSRSILRMNGRNFPCGFFSQLREAERHPCIVHYTNTKPWDGGCNSPLVNEYWKYALKTPFYPAIRFSVRRIFRNVLNYLLLGSYPIFYHLFTIRKRK
jgi:hypothetical protein